VHTGTTTAEKLEGTLDRVNTDNFFFLLYPFPSPNIIVPPLFELFSSLVLVSSPSYTGSLGSVQMIANCKSWQGTKHLVPVFFTVGVWRGRVPRVALGGCTYAYISYMGLSLARR